MAEKMTLQTAKRMLNAYEIQVRRLQKQIARQAQQLKVSQVDGLTGLLRREGFEDNVQKELSRCKRTKGHLSVFVLDLNNLKTINDTCGHQAGDEMIKGFGKLVQQSVRKGDTVARTGGDEFMILLPEQDKHKGELAKKQLLKKIEEGKETLQYFFGAAVGLASTSQGFRNFDSLYKSADADMYKHKAKLKAKAKK